MPSKTIEDFAYQVRDYMRSAEVVEGKNKLSDDEFSAVINGFHLNVGGTKKSYDATTKTLEVVTVATSNSGVYISGANFVNYINASGKTYPCVLSFFVKANKNCLLRGFMSGVSDTNLVADTWTQIYATFNSASDLNKEFHIYAYDTTAPTIQFKEMMICSEEDWNKSHTYEPYYVPVKDRLDNITPNTIYDTLWQGSSAVELDTTDVTEFNLASPYTNYKFIDVFIIDNWGNGSFVTFYGIGRGHKKGLYWAEGINGTNKTAVLSHDYTNDDNAKKLCLKVIIADGSSSFYPQAKSKVTAILGRNI